VSKDEKKYTEAYKTSAVKMVVEEGKMPVEVAGNLGMPVGLLYKWIRQYKGMVLMQLLLLKQSYLLVLQVQHHLLLMV
jgi:hypothetical protein